jgi:hypothetical protein
MTNTKNSTFNLQIAAILLMAAGWGWICGNFVQPVTQGYGQFADLMHFLPFVALLLLSVRFFSNAVAGIRSHGSRVGITIVAAFSILSLIVFIVLGAINPDPNSIGVHSVEDWMPVVVLGAGALSWVATMIFGKREQTTVSFEGNK